MLQRGSNEVLDIGLMLCYHQITRCVGSPTNIIYDNWNLTRYTESVRFQEEKCRSGGIGRRARFRF